MLPSNLRILVCALHLEDALLPAFPVRVASAGAGAFCAVFALDGKGDDLRRRWVMKMSPVTTYRAIDRLDGNTGLIGNVLKSAAHMASQLTLGFRMGELEASEDE
jgi:hypothetical protein